jgi:hypothetical protein
VRVLAFPREGPAALQRHAKAGAGVPEAARAHSGVGDAGGALPGPAESPASSGASAPSEPSPDSVLPPLPADASPLPPRSLCFGGDAMLRRRGSGAHRYAASAGKLSTSDDECSSPARRTRSDARLGPMGTRTP